MTSDNKKQAYLDGIDAVYSVEYALKRLNDLYTDNYDKLTWDERRPDIIKKLIECSRYALNVKYILLECIMEEENVLNNQMREETNGKIAS